MLIKELDRERQNEFNEHWWQTVIYLRELIRSCDAAGFYHIKVFFQNRVGVDFMTEWCRENGLKFENSMISWGPLPDFFPIGSDITIDVKGAMTINCERMRKLVGVPDYA